MPAFLDTLENWLLYVVVAVAALPLYAATMRATQGEMRRARSRGAVR